MLKQIKFDRKDGKTTANVADLYLFKDNPRDVEATDFERLKKQIQLGEHSTLLVTTEGEVLGGNTRLRAYKEIGKKTAKVVVVEIVETDEGVHIVIDGLKSERVFETVNQAKIELALSHNDSIGTNNESKLAELLTLNKIDMELYSVSTNIVPVADVVSSVSPDGERANPEDLESNYDKDLVDRNIYEPNGNDVSPDELYSDAPEHLREIIEGVTDAKVRSMLYNRLAFFVDFKMGKIADYYCNNATPEEQRAFEALGLVILDHDKAIENGFLKYKETVEAIPDEESDEEL